MDNTSNLRPCKADGVTAIFHRWVETNDIYIKLNGTGYRCKDVVERVRKSVQESHVLVGDQDLIQVRTTKALVEYKNGEMHMVDAEKITFLDTWNLVDSVLASLHALNEEDSNG
jgi:hypothetical protein